MHMKNFFFSPEKQNYTIKKLITIGAYTLLKDQRTLLDALQIVDLEIANKIEKRVCVVTDNDGNVLALKKKYENYLGDNNKEFIKICFDEFIDSGDLIIGEKNFNYNTLEPKILKNNSLAELNTIFGTSYTENDDMHRHMKANKTECALKIFDSTESVKFPQYILDAINH